MKLDSICNQVYVVAANEARIQNHEYLTPEHFLYAALMFDVGKSILEKSGGDINGIKSDLFDFFEAHVPKVAVNTLDSHNFVQMLELAATQAHYSGKDVITLGNILAAMFNLVESHTTFIMSKNGVNKVQLLKVISHEIPELKTETKQDETENSETGNSKIKEQEFLKLYSTNLTEKAKNKMFDPLIGREEVLERTIQILSRRLKNNPIHVGDPGVGKTAIVEGLAQRVVENQVPKILQGANIFYLDMNCLVAGTRYRGDFEERIMKLLDIISRENKPIVYIDEIHTVVGAGAVSGGSLDAASLLKPYLTKGELRFIGSTTFEEYKKYFEKDRALSRRFQKIDVLEPTIEESVRILMGVKSKYEDYHNVVYTDEVVELICELSSKYQRDRFLPDKAIDILDESGARVRMNEKKNYTKVISIKDIEKTVAIMAKIPENSVTASETELLKNLASKIKSQVFGQDIAVDLTVGAIKASRAGLNEAEKPIASLLYVGPTGVGKTEVAKQVAANLGIQLLRFDMSEYQEKHSVARLIGSPPGYVGYEEGGLLTEAINKTPHAVLLLDEIEKAHPDIYNVLLQIMDYGQLTDNMGKKSDFRNVLLIMTSNAGAKDLNKRVIGFDEKAFHKDAIDKEIERTFNPEFRNRLDQVIVFRNVDEDMAKQIAMKSIKSLAERLKARGVSIKASERTLKYVYSKGLSELYGAREIIRVVEKEIKPLLVDEILFGKLSKGGTATIDCKDSQIFIKVKS